MWLFSVRSAGLSNQLHARQSRNDDTTTSNTNNKISSKFAIPKYIYIYIYIYIMLWSPSKKEAKFWSWIVQDHCCCTYSTVQLYCVRTYFSNFCLNYQATNSLVAYHEDDILPFFLRSLTFFLSYQSIGYSTVPLLLFLGFSRRQPFPS
jgi:hypothetical protein